MASAQYSIVFERAFILATRDTGYRSTASAVAELIDNSIQAKAKHIRLFVEQEGVGVERQVRFAILDDGIGMDRKTLRTALRFGGSSRFDDRSGPGRFGMGLPNASVSQAKRVQVYTWKKGQAPISCYLDVDEIESGQLKEVPAPKRSQLPAFAKKHAKSSGTLVVWDKCDRLENRKASTVAAKLRDPIGRQFRYFLWDSLTVTINGETVSPIDPLFLRCGPTSTAAIPFGKPLEYEVLVPRSHDRTSIIRVRFSELPIHDWYALSVDEKRTLGITKAGGVSIVRAKREIDYGWWFFGEKRKENYDDWWRCEIEFEPELDEHFGVTHSKQSITPSDELKAILVPDLEGIAHSLNSRARSAYMLIRAKESNSPSAAAVASQLESCLRPMGTDLTGGRHLDSRASNDDADTIKSRKKLRYSITSQRLSTPEFFTFSQRAGDRVSITVNSNHPFFERLYSRLAQTRETDALMAIECLLLAAVRAELETSGTKPNKALTQYRKAWSNALAAYLDA